MTNLVICYNNVTYSVVIYFTSTFSLSSTSQHTSS